MARLDPHSHADAGQPRPRHLRLRLSVDFATRQIDGTAGLELEAPSGGAVAAAAIEKYTDAPAS